MRNKHNNRIRVVLAEQMLTNHWLAKKLNVTDMTVSRWTTNKVQPSMSQFVDIASILDVNVLDLLELPSKETVNI